MSKSALVSGSLAAVAQRDGISLAESFLSAEAIVLIDQSGSMAANDARGGRSRFDVADEELARLQATLPGKVAVIEFSTFPQFRPGGRPTRSRGTTDMVKALEFVKIADDCGVRIILISDGEPDDEEETLRVARRFKSRIDTIFIGREGDHGAEFLARLAAATGGASHKAAEPGLLADQVRQLLLTA
jgi:hypothetical protein